VKAIHGVLMAGILAICSASMGQPTTNPSSQPASGSFTVNLPSGGVPTSSTGTIQVVFNPQLVKAAYLGVGVASADATLQSQLKLPEGVGLKVVSVMADGPAAAAGLKEHDVIHKLDDQIVINPSQFEVLIRMHKPGETVKLTAIRQSQEIVIKATLVEHEMPELSWILMESNRDSTASQATQATGPGTLTIPGGTVNLTGGGTLDFTENTKTVDLNSGAAPGAK